MSKDAYYFSHDANSRRDEKILSLLMKHGMEGYGIYWSLIEMLREANNYSLSTKCDCIAYELRTHENTVKSIIQDFDLFVIEDDMFFSKSLKNRMLIKSEKARKSANVRWGNSDANALRPQSECNANGMRNDAIKGKESKVKKRKEKSKEKNAHAKRDLEIKEFRKIISASWKELGQEFVPKEEVTKFSDYWTEATNVSTKMRFQKEKVFDVTKRMRTWKARSLSNDSEGKPKSEIDSMWS